MKALVVFDSNYGNTEKIAEIIANELGQDTKALSVSEFKEKNLEGIDFLVAGCPIIGWKPSEKMENFLNNLRINQLKGIKAAAFDTRVKIFISGDAAGKVAKKLKEKGAEIIDKPQAFFVKRKENILVEGETEKASEWARKLKLKF